MRSVKNIVLIIGFCSLFCSCAGTIKTVKYSDNISEYKKAYIISAENSQYIKFKPGLIMPTPFVAYVTLPDDAAEAHNIIGNTDVVIKQQLEKYGFTATIGKRGDTPEDFDVIIEYQDTWRWDFKKILDKLEIVFISKDGKIIAQSTYNIYKNKELHNFPTPEKEVPKMIKEIMTGEIKQ